MHHPSVRKLTPNLMPFSKPLLMIQMMTPLTERPTSHHLQIIPPTTHQRPLIHPMHHLPLSQTIPHAHDAHPHTMTQMTSDLMDAARRPLQMHMRTSSMAPPLKAL